MKIFFFVFRKYSCLCLALRILRNPSRSKVYRRALIYIAHQKVRSLHLLLLIFRTTLRYLCVRICVLLKTSTSEEEHPCGGRAVNMNSYRYVKLWEVFLAFKFGLSFQNCDACFFKWLGACMSWKVQLKKKHIFIEPSVEPPLQNWDQGYEWIPLWVGLRARRFSVDMPSCSLRWHFCKTGKCLDDDLWDGFCDGAAYRRST